MSTEEEGEPPSRVQVGEAELAASGVSSEVEALWRRQEKYVSHLEERLATQEGEAAELRQQLERTRIQLADSQQREKVLVRRLAAKEQETQDIVCQVNELKSAQAPSQTSLRTALLDPAVNGLLQLLRTELQTTRSRLEDTQNELSAWKFTPDSNTGKRLMAKCRLLYQENEELGKVTSSGRVATLEGDLALQKSFSEEVRQSQLELDSFLADLDEDVEGMQSTIMFLQQELRKAKDVANSLQKENGLLRMQQNGGRVNGDASACENTQKIHNEDVKMQQVEEEERTRVNKRVRRSSVLSIDYNEDDALISANGDTNTSEPE